jgi:hypothetical protein
LAPRAWANQRGKVWIKAVEDRTKVFQAGSGQQTYGFLITFYVAFALQVLECCKGGGRRWFDKDTPS